VAANGVRQKIDLQRAGPQHGFGYRCIAPAKQDIQPWLSIRESEKLGQIVVATGLQPANSFVDGRQGAENQHRTWMPAARSAASTPAVEVARQHAIENDGIVGSLIALTRPSRPVKAVRASYP